MRSYELKVARAKEHLEALDAEIRVFMNDEFYVVAREDDADGCGYVQRVQSVKPTPWSVSALVGDAVQNLRSALDHIVWEIRPPNMRAPKRMLTGPLEFGVEPERFQAKPSFPIFLREADYRSSVERNIGLLP